MQGSTKTCEIMVTTCRISSIFNSGGKWVYYIFSMILHHCKLILQFTISQVIISQLFICLHQAGLHVYYQLPTTKALPLQIKIKYIYFYNHNKIIWIVRSISNIKCLENRAKIVAEVSK